MNDSQKNKYIYQNEHGTWVHELFERQVHESPNDIAIHFNDEEISYADLDRRADLLSQHIINNDTGSAIVGISTTKNIGMIAGVLAILKAGKAYLPLDPTYPSEHLTRMIKDAGVHICLCPDTEFSFFNSFLDAVQFLSTNANNTFREIEKPAGSPMTYVMYTSGSSGKPKGVLMGNSSLVNLLQWQKKNSVAGNGTKTLQFAPLSFDVSFQEIFSTLITGGMLVLADEDLRLDPLSLLHFIEKKSIQRIFMPFVALQYLAETAGSHQLFPISIQEVITAGEQLKCTPQLTRFFSNIPAAVLYNHYGPTETHVATALKLEGDALLWPTLPSIGKPIDHMEIFILDEKGNVLPDGEPGEISIGGKGLAEGYLNQPALTAEKFINWHHPDARILRLYKTGDLGRRLRDGNMEYLGRLDEQVKIRGYRVEPGEIEVLLNHQPDVRQAVVIAREDQPGEKKLVAYLVSADGRRDLQLLRQSIEKQLPDYMMPSAFVWMDELPKTSSGKIDKKRLPKPEMKRPALSVLYYSPATKIEKEISSVWATLLEIDKVGLNDNFFELGGNSLLALKVVAELKRLYQFNLPVTKLYQYPTVSGILQYLEPGKNISFNEYPEPEVEGCDVAVISMACRFPGANTIDEYWSLLEDGRETISFFSAEELDASIPEEVKRNPDYVKARGIIDHAEEFDAGFFDINPRLAELMDPQQRVFLEIAWEALESGGYLPSKYAGVIGVFGGSGNNGYYINNVHGNTELINRQGSFQVMTVNEKDYIASRIAYALNLTGPAVSVQSACSTSLLAIAEAVESIRKGQCELALAGGVSITVPIKSGQIYQEGGIYSGDGHNRSFDANASGTVFSDGAGIVLLKKLEDAIRDGDKIYAVVKGIGLNNDGGRKGSFTAPSAEGQSGAIQMAMHDAGVLPGELSYIEAHGTATPLGDPIEIEGLQLAFGEQERKQYCAIGSVKSNIGHCTAAAGVAGFIKTSLALYHKKIPASIHYSRSNPHIHFEESPFYINTKLEDWNNENRRIAGVSSFGVGGTNVHVILEEYKNTESLISVKNDSESSLHLIIWSAKTERSLNEYARKLADHLTANESVSMADLAYTLQTNREDFNKRCFIITSSREELIGKLRTSEPWLHNLEEITSGVVFLFPGQGSQYPGMGKELYDKEPVFRQAFDECVELLKPIMQEDIREIIFPVRKHTDATEKIHNTYYAQPAIFMIEYALAKLWISRGISPVAFVGHSIGEYVAAHLSGLFSLRDGLFLVFSRGRLMADLPAGSMLAVRCNEEKILSLLPADISLAAINGPASTVVSGPVRSVSEFSKILLAKGIANTRIRTSHAFHSAMMDSVVFSFEKIVASVQIERTGIPIVSTLTGKWIQGDEMMTPGYWSRQLRSPVRFSDALKTISESGHPVLLETGPGNALSTLVRQQTNKNLIPSVASLGSEENRSEIFSLLQATGELWMHGVVPDWKKGHSVPSRPGIKIPTYAFDRMRCWIDPVLPVKTLSGMPETASVENKQSAAPKSRKTIITEKLKAILENSSGISLDGVNPAMNFMEIGFDSLLLTQVALNLKKEFGLPVSFRQLNESHASLYTLARFLDEQLPEEKIREIHSTQVMSADNINSVSDLASASAIDGISKQIESLAKQVALLRQPSTINRDPSTINHPPSSRPFGASVRIEKKTVALSGKQKEFLDEFTVRYNKKTHLSKEYAQEHRSLMADPRVVSGFKPFTKEIVYPIVVNKSKGCRLWDLDGNEYVDALNGFGTNFLGYQPETITRALHQQIENGYELGPQHELAGKVCRLICSFTGSDRAALCNTGSEAVLGAMRIARTVTGRSLIVVFAGSYHGIIDEVIVRTTKEGKSIPAAPGILPEAVQNMLVLDYGTEETLEIIRRRSHELAAVLVEPVQSRRPEFQPVEFLRDLRKITLSSGTALIFDEVITGFRMHPGGTQSMFDIQADLGIYGKIIAGGLPIGVIAGKKLYMDALDGGFWEYGNTSLPESGVTYFAGTFVRHPLALAASLATLEYMKAVGPGLQSALNEKTGRMADELNLICIKRGIPVFVAQFGSLWKIKFKEDIPYGELLFTLMREKGIHIWDGFPCFLTAAHEAADVNSIVEKFEESVDELMESGFIGSSGGFQLVPAIEPQLEIWISCMLGGADANRSYNESVSLRFKGRFIPGTMERALKKIIYRHEALRSTCTDDGKQMCVHDEMPLIFREEDLSQRTRSEQEQFLCSFTEQNALDVFDLVKGPLFRTALFKLQEEEYYLVITAHHIVCDGWSLGIILQDLGKFYSAFTKNAIPELPPAPSFIEYSIAQQQFLKTDEHKKVLEYWIEKYRDSIPVLNIPTDFPRPRERTYKSHRLDFPLEPGLISGIKKIGNRAGCTLVTTLMAGFEVFLHQLTGEQDIVIGIPASGQSIAGLYGLVGHCVNLLPVRSQLHGNLSFSGYLNQRKTEILNDYEHQQITFGTLLKKLCITRDNARVPLVSITFNVDMGLDNGVSFADASYELIYNPREYENFEISLNVTGSRDKLELQWSYNTQLFKADGIRQMMESWEHLLNLLISEPDTAITELIATDLHQTIADDNNIIYPKNKSIAFLFSEQSYRTPLRRAVSFGNETLTYRQLEEKSNQLAHFLKFKGVRKEEMIPVCVEKSADLIVAILGILKSGCTYVPLDPEYPTERILFMMQDINARLLVCNRNSLTRLGNLENQLIVLIDEEWKYISQQQTGLPVIDTNGSDLAYVMYTSGSTGRPKGVMIENRNVVSLVRGTKYVNLSGKNILLSTGSASFDATTFEYWSMLLNGGELVLCSDEILLNSDLLKWEIRRRKVNMMWFTSGLLNQWVDLDITVFGELKTVITGGEKLSGQHIEKLRNRYPLLELINGYGPTENTTFSLTYVIKEKEITGPVPVGLPLHNRTAYVLDRQLHLCGVGVMGELYVGGEGVGRGYLNRPDLTKERFIPDPFSHEPGIKMYRTGDLARYLPDGNIEFHGRLDEQVKIRGFRIEPAEIESVIQQFPGIKQAVVVMREDKSLEKRLIAYVVVSGTFNKEEMAVYLQSKLPAYMIPRIVVSLKRIPLTSHGKLDRNALPDPDLLPEFGNRKITEAETDIQKMLAAIWMEALHVQQISMDDNFFDLGGHSLIAIRVMKMIEEKTNHRLPITALFEAPTIEKLSFLLAKDEKAVSWKSLVPIKPEGDKPPLYIVHGSGLTVLIFHALATGLSPDQPVFGLQARGLNGIDEPFDNMEDIAAYYVAEILEQNPRGPYNLAGYSFGGIVAFEMAKQLKEMGREVNMLAIFDTNADNSDNFDDWMRRMGKKFKRQFPKLKFVLRSFRKYPAETLSYQFNFLKNKCIRMLSGAGIIKKYAEVQLDHSGKINQKHDSAFDRYKLTPYSGTIDLFRVKSRMYYLDDPVYLGWKPLALQGLNIHEITGDHKTFLLPPNVHELSVMLGEIINARNSGKEVKTNLANPSSVLRAI